MQTDIRIIPKEAQTTTCWSGGTTTQAYIFPEGADYAARDFAWRLSSATVELDRSDFTPLPDYNRIILPLDGALELEVHGKTHSLLPLEQHSFDGASATVSRGKVRDFNLMLKKGVASGSIQVLTLSPGSQATVSAKGNATFACYCLSALLISTSEQSESRPLNEGDLALIDASAMPNCAITLANTATDPVTAILARVETAGNGLAAR